MTSARADQLGDGRSDVAEAARVVAAVAADQDTHTIKSGSLDELVFMA